MIFRIKIVICFFLTTAHLAPVKLNAQDIMDTVIHINEVMVFAEKDEDERVLVITAIDSAVLERNISQGLSELLSSHTPLYIRSYGYGALSTASFRGTSANHTRLFWNGMEINDPAAGQVDFSLIPSSFIDEMKIYHGNSSLFYGSGGIGGSIHMNSLPDWNKGLNTTFYHSSGSFNTHQSFVKTGGGKKDVFLQIKAFRRSSDNNFEYLNTANGLWNQETLKYSSSKKKAVQTDLYYRSRDMGIFSLHSWIQLADRNFSPVMSYMGPSREENQQDGSIRFQAVWKYYGAKSVSQFSTGISKNKLNYYLGFREIHGSVYHSKANSTNFQSRYSIESDLSASLKLKTIVNAGLQTARYSDVRNNTGFLAKRERFGASLFLSYDFLLPLSVYAVVRTDVIEEAISPLMPAAGIEFTPGILPGISLKTSLSRNYHYPDLNDLYWVPGGNPDLKPEEGYSADLSLIYEYRNSNYTFNSTLSSFAMHVNDWIMWKPGDYGFWSAENLTEVVSRGLEYQFSSGLESGKSLVRFSGTYTYTSTFSSKDEYSSKNQLIYIPVHKASLYSSIKRGMISLDYKLFISGKRFTSTDNDPYLALSSYCLHDISISGTFNLEGIDLETGIEVRNLFGKHYQVIRSRPMPGRNFAGFIRMDF